MGIIIHYAGKAKSLEAIDDLNGIMTERSEVHHWESKLVDQDVKGSFYPNWGHGFDYFPTLEEVRKNRIEFYPNMVTTECNGFFKIYDTQYAAGIREGFSAGLWPKFSIATHVKGIILYPSEKCEELRFISNMKSLDLVHYDWSDDDPSIIHGYNSCWLKTHFAGFKIHVLVCETIRLAEKDIDLSMVKDEAGYYHSRDLMVGIKNFNETLFNLKNFQKYLRNVGNQKYGLSGTSGDEI